MIRRFPQGAHPRCRVRLVFTDVSSIKTTRSGCFDTAGMRCLNQSLRCRLTLARRRSVATSDFFICVAQFAKELANGVGVRLNARRGKQGCTQLGHRDVAILRDDFGKEVSMWVQFAPAFGRPCSAASARPVRRMASAHRAPVAGESFKRRAAARPLNPSSIYR